MMVKFGGENTSKSKIKLQIREEVTDKGDKGYFISWPSKMESFKFLIGVSIFMGVLSFISLILYFLMFLVNKIYISVKVKEIDIKNRFLLSCFSCFLLMVSIMTLIYIYPTLFY